MEANIALQDAQWLDLVRTEEEYTDAARYHVTTEEVQ